MAKKIQENLRALVVVIFLPVLSQGAMAEDQTFRDVVFTDYGDSSSNPDLVRRFLRPGTAGRLQQNSKRSGKPLAAQPLNLSEERFSVPLPPHQPDRGFAL